MADCSDHSRHSSTASNLNKIHESYRNLCPESRPKSVCLSEVDNHSRQSGLRDSFDDITMGIDKSRDGVDGSVKEEVDVSGMDTIELDTLQQVKKQQPVTSSDTSSVDYVNRDPNNLQDFIKVRKWTEKSI